MAEDKRNNAPKTRGVPFKKGNPGRPKGARHKITRAVEDLLGKDADKLTRKCVEMALEGDGTAMRLCLERICPPRKDWPIKVDLPPVEKPEQVSEAISRIIEAIEERQGMKP